MLATELLRATIRVPVYDQIKLTFYFRFFVSIR